MKKKLCALFTAAALLLTAAGCASSKTVMQYEGETVTANMYRYWLSTYKGSFMNTYTDMSDTDAFWDSAITTELTAEQYLNQAVQENVKRTLICAVEFDKLGLTLSDSSVAEMEEYIESLIEERADGSRKAMNQILAQYGINIDMLREIYTMEDKTSALFSYLYGTNGANALSDAEYEQYCQDHYVRVRHIYVNNAYAYDVNENGYYSYDESGVLKTRELTAEELAEKTQKIADIETALAAGDDFDTVYNTYSEDFYYENGYYLSATTGFIPAVITAAFSLEVGEWVRVDSDYGTHFILRLEMDEKPYENEANADFFDSFTTDAQNDAFLTWLDERMELVEIDDETLSQYSIRDVSPNYSI